MITTFLMALSRAKYGFHSILERPTTYREICASESRKNFIHTPHAMIKPKLYADNLNRIFENRQQQNTYAATFEHIAYLHPRLS